MQNAISHLLYRPNRYNINLSLLTGTEYDYIVRLKLVIIKSFPDVYLSIIF
jgi:hypothetical protein